MRSANGRAGGGGGGEGGEGVPENKEALDEEIARGRVDVTTHTLRRRLHVGVDHAVFRGQLGVRLLRQRSALLVPLQLEQHFDGHPQRRAQRGSRRRDGAQIGVPELPRVIHAHGPALVRQGVVLGVLHDQPRIMRVRRGQPLVPFGFFDVGGGLGRFHNARGPVPVLQGVVRVPHIRPRPFVEPQGTNVDNLKQEPITLPCFPPLELTFSKSARVLPPPKQR